MIDDNRILEKAAKLVNAAMIKEIPGEMQGILPEEDIDPEVLEVLANLFTSGKI